MDRERASYPTILQARRYHESIEGGTLRCTKNMIEPVEITYRRLHLRLFATWAPLQAIIDSAALSVGIRIS